MQVVIIGGGVMGAATAWFLAREYRTAVTVLERDASYSLASSARSACAIRQQFSTAVNIRISQESLAFYRSIGLRLATDDESPDIGLVEPGYLYLAGTEDGATVLREQHALQAEHHVHTALLTPSALAARYPWLHVDDLMLGSLGLSTTTSGEGWFDGYAAMQAFRKAAIAAGARFVEADATGFDVQGDRVRAVRVASGEAVACDQVVIAAGAWSGRVTAWLDAPLPVFARKRDVFACEADVDLADAPLLIDPSGFWMRPEKAHGQFLCGSPPVGDDADDLPLDHADRSLFDEHIWPALAHRVPALDRVKVTSSWAGYYEMNDFDHNGLVGALPGYANAFTACGFSGHGLQQAPAIGRGLAELMMTGAYRSLDLTGLRVSRLAEQAPLLERNVI